MMTLRGPADGDHYRVQVGRARWYCDPLESDDIASKTDAAWPSVSTVKNAGGGDWSYVSLGRAADELAAHPERIAGLDRGRIYDLLTSANKRGLEAAQQRGTNVHAVCDAKLAGLPGVMLPGQLGYEYLPAVEAFFDAYQPELLFSEVVCINRGLNGVGYGGTGDGIMRIGGKVWKVDWKTRGAGSNHGAYPEEAAQIAAYATADYLIAVGTDGAPCRMPMPTFEGGLVVSIKPDGFRVYPVDLDKARAHWESLHAWWVARRTEREPIGKPWAPKAAKDRGVGGADVRETSGLGGSRVATAAVEAATPPAPDIIRRDILRTRAQSLAGDDQRRLLALWAERGLASLTEGVPTTDQLDAIEQAIDECDPFNVAIPTPPVNPVPDPPVVEHPAPRTISPPDEGDPADPTAIEVLGEARNKLDPAALSWWADKGREAADADRPINLGGTDGVPSVRRFEIARGLLELCAGECDNDEALRWVLATALDTDDALMPAVPAGRALGFLDAATATQFANLATGLVTGDLIAVVADDGTLRLRSPAAA